MGLFMFSTPNVVVFFWFPHQTSAGIWNFRKGTDSTQPLPGTRPVFASSRFQNGLAYPDLWPWATCMIAGSFTSHVRELVSTAHSFLVYPHLRYFSHRGNVKLADTEAAVSTAPIFLGNPSGQHALIRVCLCDCLCVCVCV